VSAIALIAFLLSTLEEPQSRITFLCVGAAALTTAVAVRAYATSLAELLSSQSGLGFRTVEVESACVIAGLTRRQLEVARLASQGYMAAEIGDLLHISERTVESHLAHAYSKLGINSRPALIWISERLREGARS
jgi:DNA-binding CsgD family transcriptional regulator